MPTRAEYMTKERRAWRNMLARCRNTKNPSYRYYGGKGIHVCDRWLRFEHFLADMGPAPSPAHTLEREKNERDYGPDNCRWATVAEQRRNLTTSRILEHAGRRMCVTDWARETGMPLTTLCSRLDGGLSVAEVLTRPHVRRTVMPKRKRGDSRPPPMYPHKGRDGKVRARVRLGGKDHYLGPWGSPQADAKYRRVAAEWLAAGGVAPPPRAGEGPSVNELLLAFLRHAETEYRKHGRPTSEVYCFKAALRPVADLYGLTAAGAFGPRELLAVREAFLGVRDKNGRPWSRGYVNEQVNRVRRVWSWGVEHGVVAAAAAEALRHVRGLKKTKTSAPEGRKVRPVSRAALGATLPLLRPVVAALCRVHHLLGCRATEACVMRAGDLDQHADPVDGLWLYRPFTWKTEHHDQRPEASYWVNREAQAVLAPLLAGKAPGDWVFPTGGRRGTRQGPGRYSKDSYNRAVARAIGRHNRRPGAVPIPHWSVGQIRHLRLTEVREAAHRAGRHGLEAAQAVGGHAELSTADIYAERGELARLVLRDMAGG